MNLLHNRLLRAGTLLTLATICAGSLGYVFQVLMGRLLAESDFAVFSSLNALTMIVGSPLVALTMLVTRQVTGLDTANKAASLPKLYFFWQTRVLGAFLALGCILACAMPDIQVFVSTNDSVAVWLFWGVITSNALVLINAAFLQGLQRFTWLGGLSVVIVALKIALTCWLIVAVEWGLRGALMGMLWAATTTWAAGFLYLQLNFSSSQEPLTIKGQGFQWREVLAALSATLGFAVLSQADIPLANRLFPPDIAASYAAAAVLGKAVLYLPGGIVLALFPMVAANDHSQPSRAALLNQALATTLLTCSVVAIVFSTFGDFVIGVAFDSRYPNAGSILSMYSWAMVPLSVALVLKNFFIASADVKQSFLIGGSGALLFILLECVADSPETILKLMGAVSAALCIATYAMHSIRIRKHRSLVATSDNLGHEEHIF